MKRTPLYNVWKDERVLEALKDRQPNDIAIMECPNCSQQGYYNEGSHFTCLTCDTLFYVLGEEESRPGFACVHAHDAMRLSDCVEEENIP